jgi:hypothetical protein
MTARTRALLILVLLTASAVVVIGIVVTATGAGMQPATPPTAPTTLVAPTSTTVGEPVPTGRGPSAFTTTTAPGPIQVIVEAARCAGYVGDGWRVRYRVSNAGPAQSGSVVGQVDDSPPVILEPARQLPQRGRFAEEALLVGGGDAIVLTWVGQARTVASFPIETPDCPTDPADEREAQQATTTLGVP